MKKYNIELRAAQAGLVYQKEIVYASGFETKIEWTPTCWDRVVICFKPTYSNILVVSGSNTFIALKGQARTPIFIRGRKWYHHLKW
jgi:hypothetical protein